jgi:hypothetical protein
LGKCPILLKIMNNHKLEGKCPILITKVINLEKISDVKEIDFFVFDFFLIDFCMVFTSGKREDAT